ncbi:DUF1330 domain-containing protein [Haliea sp. E17]|uniref:DUF1330 domain-containing protein n=1 Tax=Haliea sp. E17 TaxID=3401576 RepID=UPI003AAEEE41
MPAYVVFIRESEIHTPEEMAKYQQRQSDPRQYNLKPLAVYGAMETIEGEPADGLVVLEFPTVEDARAWYFSPEYQEASKHRQLAADYRGFIVEGYAPPAQ